MHQLKEMARVKHSDLLRLRVCAHCDTYIFSKSDTVCANAQCKKKISIRGSKRQFVLVDITSKIRKLYAIPDVAKHLHYAAERDLNTYPGPKLTVRHMQHKPRTHINTNNMQVMCGIRTKHCRR